jgi:RNA recognition motif-containing protein
MNPTNRVLVHNIGPATSVESLRRLFGKYGEVKDVHIPNSLNSRGQNFAFVEFRSTKDSESAYEVLNNTSIDGFVIHCQFVEQRDPNASRHRDRPREQNNNTREYHAPVVTSVAAPVHMEYPKVHPSLHQPKGAVPQPAPLLAAAPLNPAMEMTRYNTAAGGEFTIDDSGRLTRRKDVEEEQRTGRARAPASQNPLLIQSAIQIASAEKPEEDGMNGLRSKSRVMAYVKTHPQLVVDYADI